MLKVGSGAVFATGLLLLAIREVHLFFQRVELGESRRKEKCKEKCRVVGREEKG